MRRISPTSRFRRDYKREEKGRYSSVLRDELPPILELLAADQPLPQRLRDHPLSGAWKGRRDCHIRPDLVLIYWLPDNETLELVRLGSHSELGF